MHTRIKLTEILNEIGTNVSLDDDNSCSFIVNDKFSVYLVFDDETQKTCVYGYVGELPSDFELQLMVCREIASANFMWDASLANTLAMDPESDNIVYQSYYLDSTDVDFKTFLVDFAEKLEFWIERFKEIITISKTKLVEMQNEDQDSLSSDIESSYSHNQILDF